MEDDAASNAIGCHLTQAPRDRSAVDDVASSVIGCHLTQETRVQSAVSDAASNTARP